MFPKINKKRKSRNILIVAAAFFLIFAFVSVHSVHALSFPSGINNYVALNISNSQSTATPNPFQQMINITSADNGWTYINDTGNHFGQNVEFFYSNGTVIPSWLENYTSGHAIWWVKVGSIAANSKITIYMGFASKTTNLFNTNDVGEAPQLSSTYAEYDDGANVFNFYDDFKGTSLNTSKWTVSGITYTVDNGFSATASAGLQDYIASSSYTAGVGTVVDFYGNPFQSGTTWEETGLSTATNSNNEGSFIQGYDGAVFGQQKSSNGNSNNSGDLATSSTTGIYSTSIASSSTSYYQLNYGTAQSVSANAPTYPLPIVLVKGDSGTFSDTYFVQWIDVRAYPPNGVMPSISFGSVQSTAIILYLNGISNANTTITYGTESNFTAVLAIDYVSIYVNGTKVASLTQGKAVYLKTLSAGLYKITAATNTSGVSNVTYYETINKAARTLSATVNGKALGNYTFRDANLSLNGTVSPKILTAKFYDNGKLLGNSPQTILYNFSTFGNNIIVFNTSGNQNYSAASITGTINLTTNQFIIQDIAQNSSEISKFNLTVKNSPASKSFTNLAYNATILS